MRFKRLSKRDRTAGREKTAVAFIFRSRSPSTFFSLLELGGPQNGRTEGGRAKNARLFRQPRSVASMHTAKEGGKEGKTTRKGALPARALPSY